MVLDPIPQSLPVHFFGSRHQPPTSHYEAFSYVSPERHNSIIKLKSSKKRFFVFLTWTAQLFFFVYAASPKSTESRNWSSSVQIQMNPKSHFEFVPRDTKKSDFLGFANLGYAVCCSVLQQFQCKLSYIHALGIRIYTFRLHIYYMCIQIDVNICVWHVYIHF